MISYYNYKNKPILFAHRGMNSFAPENSLKAFELCIENNIPAIELDVHLCKSGELVVIHDFSTLRLTNKDYKIEALNLSEIKELDIGKYFKKEYETTRIPTLEEVFQLCSNNVLYDIEIKTNNYNNNEISKKLWNLIRKYKLEFNTIVTSFNPFALRSFEKISNHALLEGAIFSMDKEVPYLLRKGLGSYFFNCNIMKPHINLLNENAIQEWKDKNLKILPWCIDDIDTAKKILNFNIMGIITNVPEIMKKTKLFDTTLSY